MQAFNPYLHFMGNTEEAMRFYKTVFGGEFILFHRFKDVPGGEKMAAEDQEKIIHISLAINKDITIMATDALASMGQQLTAGNNFHIHMQADSEAEADKIFNALSTGGKIDMPMNKTFFGAYFGMCQDRFGIYWMINFTEKIQ